MRKRLRFAFLVGPVAALAVLFFAAPAVAQGPSSTALDPQTANIPYVAWAGEQVRIAKCLGQQEMERDLGLSASTVQTLRTGGVGSVLRASWTVERCRREQLRATLPERSERRHARLSGRFGPALLLGPRLVAQAGHGGHQGRRSD